MEFSGNLIRIDRELSDLDRFALRFIKVLKKHTRYVIISGYVAILLGRARVSEDIDIIIPKLNFNDFEKMHKDLQKSGFYCLNAENIDEVYSYLRDKIAIRYAKRGKVIPNIELKFSKNKIDEISLEKNVIVKLGRHKLVISDLALQIAFKEKILKSPKDIEDARHIRNVAHPNEMEIQKYKEMLDGLY